MTKTQKTDRGINTIREGGTLRMNFTDMRWFLMKVERYKLGFDLKYTTEIIGNELTLTGVK